ncbi:MAG TPA: class I SAM-dependent methyltransferase [Anaerolineae bacterium]|nr:class I SAM-dependent methyltransferase [Anaerolineae bacterium]
MTNQRKDRVWQSASIAAKYLQGTRAAVPLAAEQIDVMLRVLAHSGKRIHRLLDLGCGDGILTQAVLDQYSQAEATLLDFSEPMIEAARERLGEQVRHRFIVADYAEPAWLTTVADRAPFDAIVSGYSIHHQPDARKQALYAELFDLLSPGGFFINIEHVGSPTPWVESLWDHAFIDSLYERGFRRDEFPTREALLEAHLSSDERAANLTTLVETQCVWLRQIGFTDVDCYFKIFELAVFGGRRPAG